MGKRPFVDRSHIWDDPELLHQATGRQSWEQNPMPRRQPDTRNVEEPASDIASEDEDFAPDVGPDAAGEEFVQTLLELHFAGKLAAKALCILCYWAEKAGVAAAKITPSGRARLRDIFNVIWTASSALTWSTGTTFHCRAIPSMTFPGR